MIIAHNMTAINAQGNLKITGNNKNKALERLSSGYKINRAADNAAGLAISEEMRGQIKGLNRGATNTADGISLTNVADGALSEVHSILQRMRELSVQAANDTNADEDRAAIQNEIDCLKNEVDRIADQTEFNTRKLFKGGVETLCYTNGSPVDIGSLQVSDFELRDLALGNTPFSANSSVTQLRLNTYINPSSNINPANWNLIYGSGSTSNMSIRAKYTDDYGNQVTRIANASDMSVVPGSYSYDDATKTYSRTIMCNFGNGAECSIKQSVSIGNNDGNEQYYTLSYECTNTGTKAVDIDFMVALDTAYNNNDRCESYFTNGTRINNCSIYTDDAAFYDPANQYSSYIHAANDVSTGLSIVNEDAALPFTEKIKWENGQPDAVCVGRYSRNDEWGNYGSNLSSGIVGGSTRGSDLEVSLMWNNNHQDVSDVSTFSFKYGICDLDYDPNPIPIPPDRRYHGSDIHSENLNLWIQAGANSKQGMDITIGEMDSRILRIDNLDMSSNKSANEAISNIDYAIERVSTQRNIIGSQTNRLAFANDNDLNMSENLQASESKIRDADMAEEMVTFSAQNILEQAGMSVLAQANQSKQGILSLLS